MMEIVITAGIVVVALYILIKQGKKKLKDGGCSGCNGSCQGCNIKKKD
ncbi:FeoB-associated Cys-rich membrane protein [Clostridium senegalense]|nr:FeoB-associated Cys-rich membrane protein [Clostridium senegalense]